MPGASISCEDMSACAEGLAQTRGAVGGKWDQRGINAQCMTPWQKWTVPGGVRPPSQQELGRRR